ncbi:hypothetical protein RR46_13105 [Papilio xuthus]|uniref:Uncharacterized protein n=1 Tax=Papilio xuthus TaxID=66420 RepID=A0A194PS36_PAPXU|nr:hypothetical protein RR46_13105 [Papilio xuthus]
MNIRVKNHVQSTEKTNRKRRKYPIRDGGRDSDLQERRKDAQSEMVNFAINW